MAQPKISPVDISIELNHEVCYLKPRKNKHKYTFIYFAGFGVRASISIENFLCPEMIDLLTDMKVVLPQSPFGKVTMMGGQERHRSFDFETLSADQEEFDKFNKDDLEE